MRRTVSLLAFVLSAVVVWILVGRPSVVTAGHTSGLQGRTHLIVKEHNLKVLSFTAPGGGNSFTASLHERNRDGSLNAASYVVPLGRVFIVTDVKIDLGPGQFVTGSYNATLTGTLGDRWTLRPVDPNVTDVAEEHFSGGIAYDSGSTVDVYVNGTLSGFSTLVNVIGYETVDV